MSDGSRCSLIYKKQSGAGTFASGTFTETRFIDDDIKPDTETLESDEIRADGNIARVDRVGIGASGQVRTHWSYATYDDWLEYLLRADSTYAGMSDASGTITTSSVDNSFNASDNIFTSPNWEPGRIARAFGWAASINGVFVVTSRPSNAKIIVAGKSITTDGTANASKHIKVGASIINGTTLPYISLERRYNDLTTTYQQFLDMCLNGANIELVGKQYVNAQWDWVGRSGETDIAASIASGVTAANTNPLFPTTSTVPLVVENGTPLVVTELAVRVENNLRPRDLELNQLGPTSQGMGDFRVTGRGQAYFNAASAPLLQRYEAGTTTNIAIAWLDSTGAQGNGLYLPSVFLQAGRAGAAGRRGDVMADFEFTCYVGTPGASSYTMRATKIS